MPDFIDNHAVQGTPGGWGEIFAALPAGTPPADGWARLDRALDVRSPRMRTARRERRISWLIGTASAAVLILVAWSPLSRWLHDGGADAQQPSIAATVPHRREPVASVRADPEVATKTQDVATGADVALPASSPEESARRKPVPKARGIVKRTEANTRASRRSGAASPGRPEHPASGAATGMVATNTPASQALQRLKAQSAQLEALVALARDDRVGNAGSELLSSGLDAGIAAIDAALSEPALGDARQQDLWQRRVDLLQQLAGMEATSRWLAAQGTASNTTLVSVD